MKINVNFWISIITISIIVIILKNCNFSFKEDYIFNRKILENKYLSKTKFSMYDNISENDFINVTDNFLLTNTKINLSNLKFNLYNIIENKKISSKITTIPNRNISFYKDSSVYYIDKFTLFSKNIFSNDSSILKIKNFNITNAFPLDNKDEFLVIGQYLKDNKCIYGFYKYNKKTKTNLLVFKLNNKINNIAIDFLTYSGIFSSNNEYIIFTLDKSSSIFIFNKNGLLLKKIKTEENVPNAQIVNYNGNYGYKRGQTFSTNIGSFVYKDELHVISNRIKNNDFITIDIYSIENNKYLNSYKIDSLNIKNKEINNVFQINNIIIINTLYKFYIFKTI